jgi:hypothetical protein
VLAGILLGLGFAVKPTMLLVAVGLVIGVRRQRRVVAGLAAAFGVVVMADVLLIGRAGVGQMVRASGLVSAGSPWRADAAFCRWCSAERTGYR